MKYYRIDEASEMLGVSAQTLRNWDKSGKLIPHHKSANGHRYYAEDDLNAFLHENQKDDFEKVISQTMCNGYEYFVAINRKTGQVSVGYRHKTVTAKDNGGTRTDINTKSYIFGNISELFDTVEYPYE